MTAREVAVAAVLEKHGSDRLSRAGARIRILCRCGAVIRDYESADVAVDDIHSAVLDHRAHVAAAIIAALDTPTATETGTYPCCSECGPGCSGRHESRCHCQTAELLAIADEGAARARGAL